MTGLWRLALRDLRGSRAGLRLMAVCLFLGVAALALQQVHLQQMVLQTQAVEGVVNGRMRPLMFLEKAAPVS